MPCYTPPPSVSIEQWLSHMFMKAWLCLTNQKREILVETKLFLDAFKEFNLTELLCITCKLLTKEQMQSVNGLDCYQGLWQWYVEHLLHDFSENFHYTNAIETTICLKEADRLGLILKNEGGIFSIEQI